MSGWLLDLPIQTTRVLVPVYAAAAVLVVALLVPVPGVRSRLRVFWPVALLAAGLGALAGSLLVYVVVDVEDVFGAPASLVIRGAAAAAGAGVGIAVANLVRTRWWRKIVAILTIPLVVAAGGLLINRDVAYYPKLGDALGLTGVSALVLGHGNDAEASLKTWRAPAGMRSTGRVGTVTIPGTESHWHGRAAWVYEPPAALVKNPPRLPVVIAFSGQPGGPEDVFLAGNLQGTLDGIAKAHHGIAPIVVVPDQLGSYNVNPECVNSKMGNVERYVVDDVREWVLQHLPVSTSRSEWSVAGFSEGGTCAVQFGTGYPAIFGSYLAISPELGPINGSVARSVREAFHGSLAAFKAAQPVAIMQRKRPYRHTLALYCVGANDKRYGAVIAALARASRSAGMRTSTTVLPGVAHNWNTGAAGFAWGLPKLLPDWGIS
ncbi:alpha/beta hydrolase-fold protein [Amnibacterium sp. CER49]|uniref:alpha/beta hydrolase n=1 Tax=Amnibacterium sp. CER49 TaxID=3039161 RepID=UPI0024478284|nr:alpha/beta hydrolase-fold protein [Amnibacterium sp. CER49]MDH2442440.1 alpha/beta hydrolase-fold protein [Amnibacterium sp. CER49]